MLYALHTAATDYFTHVMRNTWNDAVALQKRERVLELAAAAGVTGERFTSFTCRVAAQVLAAA